MPREHDEFDLLCIVHAILGVVLASDLCWGGERKKKFFKEVSVFKGKLDCSIKAELLN